MSDRTSPQARIQFDNRLLSVAEVLAGAGSVLWLAGVSVAGAALRRAVQQWAEQQDQPIGTLAKGKWQQLVSAKEAGSHAWKHGGASRAS